MLLLALACAPAPDRPPRPSVEPPDDTGSAPVAVFAEAEVRRIALGTLSD